MSAVQELKSAKELEELGSFKGLVVVHFWAPWSQPCKQMNEAMEDLAKEYVKVKFFKVEAEEFAELSLKYEVAAVPTFIFLKAGQVVDRVNGAHVPELSKKTAAHSQTLAPSLPTQAESRPTPPKEDLDTRLKKLLNSSSCMAFIKGTPQEPRCGFSRQLVEILKGKNAEFGSFNILLDEEVRQGLKKYSDWPTYPQLYVNGELVGGLDIIKEMNENGELDSILPKAESLDVRLKSVINQRPVMLFMKGTRDQPRCGFSRTMCEILSDTKIEFSTFDILEDEEVRQGLKKFSNWPTYPQLYVKGELIGGLDIVRELKESNELLSTLGLDQ